MPEITAKLRKIIWRSLENDYTIAAFQTETGSEIIATGDIFTPAKGITYQMTGKWEEHHKYGEQFKIETYCVQEPVAAGSIAIYLEKHIKGVGPVLAKLLIEKYGKHTISILKNAPERVSNENKGISYDLALKISEQLQEGDKRQDVLIQIEGIFSKVKGLPGRLAVDLLNIYGLTTFEVVKSNPYVLTGMHRVGFILADRVAMACGVRPDDPERIKAGIIYVIKQTMQETGDVWLAPGTIAESLMNLISGVRQFDIISSFHGLIEDKILVKHKGLVTLVNYAADEDTIANCIVRFLL